MTGLAYLFNDRSRGSHWLWVVNVKMRWNGRSGRGRINLKDVSEHSGHSWKLEAAFVVRNVYQDKPVECGQVSSAWTSTEHFGCFLKEKNKWNVKLLMFTQRQRTNSTLWTISSNWTKQMQILSTTSLIRCRCDGNRWRQMQHCTLGTFSDGCRSASSRTRNRKRGSTLSKQHPLHVNCSMDTSTGPVKQTKTDPSKTWTKLFL